MAATNGFKIRWLRLGPSALPACGPTPNGDLAVLGRTMFHSGHRAVLVRAVAVLLVVVAFCAERPINFSLKAPWVHSASAQAARTLADLNVWVLPNNESTQLILAIPPGRLQVAVEILDGPPDQAMTLDLFEYRGTMVSTTMTISSGSSSTMVDLPSWCECILRLNNHTRLPTGYTNPDFQSARQLARLLMTLHES
jgi:hypothetical protein